MRIYEWLRMRKRYELFIVGFFVFGVIYIFFHSPPKDFPIDQVISIEEGESLQSITDILYEKRVVRSPFWFRTHVILLGGEKRVIAGSYLLDRKEGPVDLAYRLVKGQFHLDSLKITVPEGWNIYQMSDYLGKNLINFDQAKFLVLAKNEEGYLFPDTYFVSPVTSPELLIERMKENFEEKIKEVSGIATSTHSLKNIIIMASILEGEARMTETRRIVAGILWKRLSIGMPLQVDSTFIYINGKNTYELTDKDLKIDSPYNTYKYNGLPPGPIGNPGLDSIFAAVNPISSKYLYFLSSKSGDMYYARTFEEHKRNKELYLNK